MKILISLINSNKVQSDRSVLCFDLQNKKMIWGIKDSSLSSCGMCYFDSALWFAGDNNVTKIDRQQTFRFDYQSKYPMQLHSIHPIGKGQLGLVDTGNSVIRIIDSMGKQVKKLSPLESWGDIPADVIHLNDFAVTPHGIIASCFDYRPYRKVREDIPWSKWCSQRYGILINVTGNHVVGPGAIVGCGFNHPHSLVYHEPFAYLCSSATGSFVRIAFDKDGFVQQKREFHITSNHFLRGAMRVGKNWVLGGSSMRHGEVLNSTASLFFFNENTKLIREYDLGFPGDIYDIIPCNDEIEHIVSSLR